MKALILNVDHMPLSIIESERAFVLWYKDRVYIEENYEGEYFNTVDNKYPVPSIVRIKHYIYYRYDNVSFTKSNIFKRDNYKCQYCGKSKNLTIDHVIPTSKGGEHKWNNVITACKTCNQEKSNLTEPDIPDKFRKDLGLYRPHAFLMMKRVGNIPKQWEPYLFMN